MSHPVVVASPSGAADAVAELGRYDCNVLLVRRSSDLLETIRQVLPGLLILDVGFDDVHVREAMQAMSEPPLNGVCVLLVSHTTTREQIGHSIATYFHQCGFRPSDRSGTLPPSTF